MDTSSWSAKYRVFGPLVDGSVPDARPEFYENHFLDLGYSTAFAADKLPTRRIYGAQKRVYGLLPQMK